MASYDVEITGAAERQLRKLDRSVKRRLLDAIWRLAEEPRPPGARKLTGPDDIFRIRVGRYRILYEVRDSRLIVMVLKVGHRRDVYR